MLFGAGMVILTDRVADKANGWVVMRRYYVRNLILFAFGLVHVFILLWPGDILHTYGIAALVAFLFRRLRPQWLIMIGLTLALFQLGGGGYFGYYLTLQTRAQVAAIEAKVAAGAKPTAQERKLLKEKAEKDKKRAEARAKSHNDIAAEDKAREGNFRSWTKAQWAFFLDIESQFLEILFVWEAASVMLIGAALYKLGILQGRRSIYIAQTLICLWVLYPPFMLGLYGKMTWGPLMVTAFFINAALLVGANLWVRHFDIAPVEWAWRSLVERRVLPWRKRARVKPQVEGSPALA